MDNVATTEREYIDKAIDLLGAIGLVNPTMKQIKKCIDGLKNGEKFAKNWYLQRNDKKNCSV